MSIEESIFYRMASFAGLSAIVGNQIYPIQAPSSAQPPYLAYWRVSNPTEWLMGSSTSDILEPRFQVDCFSTSFSQVRAIARQVRGALDKWGGTTGGVVVIRSDVVNEGDGYDWDLKRYQSFVEIEVQHTSTL